MKFYIVMDGEDDERLPSSHTCFNQLLIPKYTSKEKLRQKLETAIENATGFGMVWRKLLKSAYIGKERLLRKWKEFLISGRDEIRGVLKGLKKDKESSKFGEILQIIIDTRIETDWNLSNKRTFCLPN